MNGSAESFIPAFFTAGRFHASAGACNGISGPRDSSIATYVMCGFRRTDVRSNESSMKYFILGSFSSAFLLYGIALTYGATSTAAGLPGTTNIAEIARRLPDAQFPLLLFAGAAMMLVGFGFKIATAPFHVWTPDVYEGAPTPVTALWRWQRRRLRFVLRVSIAFPFGLTRTNSPDKSLTDRSALVLAILTILRHGVQSPNNVKRRRLIVHACRLRGVGFLAPQGPIWNNVTPRSPPYFLSVTYLLNSRVRCSATTRATQTPDRSGGLQRYWFSVALAGVLLVVVSA